MENEETLKAMVKEKYSQIAQQSKNQNETACCGVSCGCSNIDYTIMADDYANIEGYNSEADLGLGCGLPTEFAHLKEGDVVVDLGAGAGNDCFVARSVVGNTGKIIGIDMTETMINKARKNVEKLGFQNVDFILGEIENIPLESNFVDVVISNCVLNLIPNKEKALQETYRILKKGGHFSISDIVLEGNLPKTLQKEAEMYAGCVSGAIQKQSYLDLILKVGFQNVMVQKQKEIILPTEILEKFMTPTEIENFQKSSVGIYSITVYAEK